MNSGIAKGAEVVEGTFVTAAAWAEVLLPSPALMADPPTIPAAGTGKRGTTQSQTEPRCAALGRGEVFPREHMRHHWLWLHSAAQQRPCRWHHRTVPRSSWPSNLS